VINDIDRPDQATAPADADALRARIVDDLSRARERTAVLTDAVDDDDLIRQHSRLMSPLVWDLAHVGNQEELWLLRDVGGRDPMLPETVDELYDAFQHPRFERPTLPLLDPQESRRYVREVRGRVLDLVERTAFSGRPLVQDGFAFGMIVQHEQQHDETMLATHQLRRGAPVLTAPPPPDPGPQALSGEVLVPGGAFTMGTSAEPWALDNERPAHDVHVPAFWIDTTPVTNAAYQRFIEDGGYDDPRWWTPQGWQHRQDVGLTAPAFWKRDGGSWVRRRFGRAEPVPPDEPVMHVSWYEADAYARWAGRRLPTEAEWEKAARHDPATGGSYPDGASTYGARQLIGDVWEWTATDFHGYPGFRAWPYREYSEVFFGTEYKVLRGGSFGTDAAACRGTFRNWDYPIRRQIFSGFRCARDAAPGEG
jgi:iron(II)-dependent oxidoreductase